MQNGRANQNSQTNAETQSDWVGSTSKADDLHPYSLVIVGNQLWECGGPYRWPPYTMAVEEMEGGTRYGACPTAADPHCDGSEERFQHSTAEAHPSAHPHDTREYHRLRPRSYRRAMLVGAAVSTACAWQPVDRRRFS